MDGEDLYAIYLDALADEGVLDSSWDELEDQDKAVWNTIASKVELKE